MFLRLFLPLLLFAASAALGQPAVEGAPGFSVDWIDKSAAPCQDFYQFACGSWMERHPIPADQSRWSQFNLLLDRNQDLLRETLEELGRTGGNSDEERKLGAFYAACMDEGQLEQTGLKPIQQERAAIAALGDSTDLAQVLAKLHQAGVPAGFAFGAMPDYKNASMNMAAVAQSGLGLPDRDYYFKTDERSTQLREQYEAHIAKTFELAGDSPEKAKTRARRVLEIEKALAEASLDRVAMRQPENRYHKMERGALEKLSPSFKWDTYLEAIRSPKFESLNVQNPEFVKRIEELLKEDRLAAGRDYLEWHLLRTFAPYLNKAMVQENFEFFGKTLTGARELRPRWKRCVQYTDELLGEALGKKYVEKAFAGDAKQKMLEMVNNIQKALENDIGALDWMTQETKARALKKLQAIRNKIGYPENWRDYASVQVSKDDPVGNVKRANRFEFQRDLHKIGQKVDPLEWSMTPPTVNAYYSSTMNNINFPAGILQPPFYTPQLDDAVNYGGIGSVIGHELTHGFDDQGRKFGPTGNLEDWWTDKDRQAFEERAACVDSQYGGYTAIGEVKVNGKLTLGENVADNGGLRLAYMAFQESIKNKRLREIEGYTPDQRFFLGWAQVWCQNITEEAARLRALTDPHSPGRYRVNGVVSNMPEFRQAFQCKANDPMVRTDRCQVW